MENNGKYPIDYLATFPGVDNGKLTIGWFSKASQPPATAGDTDLPISYWLSAALCHEVPSL